MNADSFPRVLLLGALLAMAGCESPATKPAPAAAWKEVTGREAFQNMYLAARGWLPDARPYRLTNLYRKESPGIGGHAAVWTASFASTTVGKSQAYTYSTIKTESLHLGVFAGHEERFSSPSELGGVAFEVLAFRVDSDKAFAAAEGKGGEAFRKKHPQTPVTFLLS